MTRYPITQLDAINMEFTREIERLEREYDAGALEPDQFEALIHCARVRKQASIDRLVCTEQRIDETAGILIESKVLR